MLAASASGTLHLLIFLWSFRLSVLPRFFCYLSCKCCTLLILHTPFSCPSRSLLSFTFLYLVSFSVLSTRLNVHISQTRISQNKVIPKTIPVTNTPYLMKVSTPIQSSKPAPHVRPWNYLCPSFIHN